MMRSAILATLLAVGIAAAPAQGRWQARGEREEIRPGPRLLDELKLTDQQKDQWQELHFALEKKQTATRAKVDVARIELRELMSAEKLDKVAIEKKTKEVSDLQYQLKLARIDHMFGVLNILTPEQQKEWKEHMARPRPLMRERMRPHMRGPRCGGGPCGAMDMPPFFGEPAPAPEPDED